jgi:uncharacterized protein (TIGR03118 family)
MLSNTFVLGASERDRFYPSHSRRSCAQLLCLDTFNTCVNRRQTNSEKRGKALNTKRIAQLSLPLIFISLLATQTAHAQANNYQQVDLVSNVPGLALNDNPTLRNPWGIAFSNGQPFRIAANKNGSFMSYDGTGAEQGLGIAIAVPAGDTSTAQPTGVVANPTSLFVPPQSQSTPFLFATEDGTISTEYADARGDILVTTILVVDNSPRGAVYTGLAVLTPDCCNPFLAAADFHGGLIDTFTGSFEPLGIPGAFIDSKLPLGYSPYNLNVIGNQVFVTYALRDAALHDPVIGAGNGVVDIYGLDGSFVRRFASNGPLNAPWGVVKSSANFGAFSNDILIGNFGDGIINAFDPESGQFLGALKQTNGNTIVNLNLHGMVFGGGTTGDPDTLYITAGLAGGVDGVFGAISANAGGAAPDFSLNASPSDATVAPGQSASFSLTATPIAAFRGIFSFSCAAPTGIACTVSTNSVNQATGAATVTVTVTPSARGQLVSIAGQAFPGMLIAGIGIWVRTRRAGQHLGGRNYWIIAIACLGVGLSAMTGCSSGSRAMQPSGGMASIVVTASANSVSHNTTLNLTVQ